jgi:hypothetical protein
MDPNNSVIQKKANRGQEVPMQGEDCWEDCLAANPKAIIENDLVTAPIPEEPARLACDDGASRCA